MSSSLYYKLISIVFTVVLLASCGAKKTSVARKTNRLNYEIVDYGKKYLHKPYRYAGKGPNAFDCSGYTSFVFRKFGYNLNASAAGQEQQTTTVKRKEDLQVGDLVFFEGRSHNGRVGHVGIVSAKGRGANFKFIHASTTNGVIITSSNEPYYRARYLRGGRVIENDGNMPVQPPMHNKDERYAKADDKITYKETDNGFVIIDNTTGKPAKETEVAPENPLKPTKKKQQEDQNDKESEIRQLAITVTEESIDSTTTKRIHRVKPGETLYSIAKKHKCSIKDLKRWNPGIKKNQILAGDELDIYQ